MNNMIINKSTDDFEVKMPNREWILGLIVVLFIVAVSITLFFVFEDSFKENDTNVLVYVIVALLVFPFLYMSLFSFMNRITVCGSKITVRRLFRYKFTIDVSEITRVHEVIVYWRYAAHRGLKGVEERYTLTVMADSNQFKVIYRSHNYKLGGFFEFREYLYKYVDSSKIITEDLRE